jgi:hypothetical protein
VPLNKNVRDCQHIKVTGVQCGSPAMRGEQFCYFHQRMLRGVSTPPNARLHPIAMIENEQAIQASLMEVINALARNHIDLRRADLILKALWIAAKNSRYARFDMDEDEMVRETPEYAAPAPPKPQVRKQEVPKEKELPKIAIKDAIAQVQASALAAVGKPQPRKTEVTPFAAPIDTTQRKPAARAGMPSTTQAAVNQANRRT